MSIIAFWIWLGGIGVAYRRIRKVGCTVVGSMFNSLAWPIGVGYWIATNCFDPEVFK